MKEDKLDELDARAARTEQSISFEEYLEKRGISAKLTDLDIIEAATLEESLDELASLRDEVAEAEAARAAARARVQATVKAQLDAIDNRYADEFNEYRVTMAALETAIKAQVLTRGSTVKSHRLQAVFTKGRRSVKNLERLIGFLEGLNKVDTFIEVGEPSVSFREVKNKENK